MLPHLFFALLVTVWLAAPLRSMAQVDTQAAVPVAIAASDLPDGPTAQNQPTPQSQNQPPSSATSQSADPSSIQQPHQTKRILGIVPNFQSVSADQKLPPQSAKEKFVGTTEDSFDYSSIFLPALLAAYSQGTRADGEFGNGAVAYGRYFWRAAVDQTDENYLVGFVFPVITREDSRYYTLGHGGFAKRAGYALSRVVITRNDAGRNVFNISEVVGAGAASGISSTYYPSQERSFSNTATEWGLDVGLDAATFLFKEFWPDVNQRLFHGRD